MTNELSKERIAEAKRNFNYADSNNMRIDDIGEKTNLTIRAALALAEGMHCKDLLLMPKRDVNTLWTLVQAISYHARMDTIKGKRRGRWIEPKAQQVIDILYKYEPETTTTTPEQEGGV